MIRQEDCTYMCQFDLVQWPVLVVDRDPLHRIERRISAINHLAKYCVLGVKVWLL